MKTVVKLAHVQKYFGQFCALDNISFNLNQGEILGLLGHNGAGKTTCMKLILGVIGATSGTIRLFGESPIGSHSKVLRQRIGFLPEHVSFYNQLSAQEVIDYFAKLKSVNIKYTSELIERVGLSHAANRRIKTYSKGMRQRLGLAQALLGKPELLLLDEPTAGLDPVATSDFYESMDTLRKQGTTIILSSHALQGIEKHIDRTLILGNGKLLASGSVTELSEQAQLPLTIYVDGEWSNINWQQQLKHHEVKFSHLNNTRLELSLPLHKKMDVMRVLLAEPAVKNFEVATPSLENLYNYYNKQNSLDK